MGRPDLKMFKLLLNYVQLLLVLFTPFSVNAEKISLMLRYKILANAEFLFNQNIAFT
jgi:hypothetical protein